MTAREVDAAVRVARPLCDRVEGEFVAQETRSAGHAGYCESWMCIAEHNHTHSQRAPPMRTNIEIDDTLMAEAQKASGHATKKQTVEQALRLMIRLRRQREVDLAFGKYRWRGNLARSRKGRRTG